MIQTRILRRELPATHMLYIYTYLWKRKMCGNQHGTAIEFGVSFNLNLQSQFPKVSFQRNVVKET